MAAGHNCWGILWGPITGKLMVQLMAGEATEVDLRPFDPERFM
jgi:glycine/D-amino acid oxidase-like deaminating enzyme